MFIFKLIIKNKVILCILMYICVAYKKYMFYERMQECVSV